MATAFRMCGKGVALLLVLTATAVAQPSSQADAEFKRGKALMAQNKYAEACAAFDKSQQLEASVSVMLNQANCREKNGQLATARKLFVTAAAQTDRASDPKDVQFHNVALEKAAKLGDRVSTLTIDVPAASRVTGLVIKRDGDVIDQMSWSTAIQLDGGTYKVEASAPDRKPWSTSVTLGNEKDRKSVAVPVLEAVAKPDTTGLEKPEPNGTQAVVTKPDTTKPDTTKPGTTKPDTTKPDTTKPDTTKPDTTNPNRYDMVEKVEPGKPRSKLVPILVGGGGLVLVGASLGFMSWAGTTYDKAKAEGNDDKQLDLWHSANNRRYIAEGLGAAGIAAIGVSVWLFVRSGSEPQRTIDHPAMIVPTVDGDRAALVVSGRF